jgi:hypothetical protein
MHQQLFSFFLAYQNITLLLTQHYINKKNPTQKDQKNPQSKLYNFCLQERFGNCTVLLKMKT